MEFSPAKRMTDTPPEPRGCRHLLLALSMTLLLILSACTSLGGKDHTADIQTLEKKLAEANRKLDEMHHRASVMQFMVDHHERAIMNMEKTETAAASPIASLSAADISGTLPPAVSETAGGDGAIRPLAKHTAGLAQGPIRSKSPVSRTAHSARVSPEQRYAAARKAYNAGEYRKAIPLFEQMASEFPNHKLANNALYWKGECLYGEKDYISAIDSFDRLVREYPRGSKVPDALLKTGFAYVSLDKLQKARTILRKVITNYPFNPAGTKAEAMLKKIEGP